MCTDGAPVNEQMYRLVRDDVGKHYLLTLCPAHKIELGIKDGFENSSLNSPCDEDYLNIYYLFKRANLRWRLLKQQALFMVLEILRHKRPTGTRWVEHQTAAIASHLHNLPILIRVLQQSDQCTSQRTN